MSLAAGTPAPQTVWASLDEARRNAAYDNNAAVANSAALVEARNAASAAYRKAHSGSLDIPYAPGARTAFDLYPARRPARALSRLHPWRLLAPEFARALRRLWRRVGASLAGRSRCRAIRLRRKRA